MVQLYDIHIIQSAQELIDLMSAATSESLSQCTNGPGLMLDGLRPISKKRPKLAAGGKQAQADCC